MASNFHPQLKNGFHEQMMLQTDLFFTLFLLSTTMFETSVLCDKKKQQMHQ